MRFKTQSLPARQQHSSQEHEIASVEGRGRRSPLVLPKVHGGEKCPNSLPRWAFSLALGLLMVACSKKEETKTDAPAPVPAAQAPSPSEMKVADAELDEQISKVFAPAGTGEPPSTFPAVTTDLAILAQDIMEKHPGKNAEELLGVPEVKEKLGNALKKLAADKELQNLVNSSVHLAAQIKGLEGPPGTHAMNMDLKTYDKPRTARMLENVLSEDPRRVVNFIVQELGEAAVDLSYGGLDKSLNGISIVPNPNPPPAPPQPAEKKPD